MTPFGAPIYHCVFLFILSALRFLSHLGVRHLNRRGPENGVDVVFNLGALTPNDESLVDALLYHSAEFTRGVNLQRQILAFAVLTHGVAAADRTADRISHPFGEFLKHRSVA